MKPLILAALTVPAAVTAMHQGHAGLHQGFFTHVHAFISQRLELTPEQQGAIHKVFLSHHTALHAKAKAAFDARANVLQSLADAQTTEGQIRELEALATQANLAFDLELGQTIREITPLLTEVQRGKVKQLVAKGRAHVEGFLAAKHATMHAAKP